MKTKGIRITYFSLKNFAPLYVSMGIKDFTFDRKNSKNNIVLILGENGSGKTYLLTEFSPEALEHIQGRTSNRFIKGEEGKKTVVFTVSDNDGNDTDEYKCTITYSSDKKKTVCSFIHKNLVSGVETELNPNGNVSSYMDLCKHYLGYDKNYKNIGYISSDVKNIVSMSFNERQQLISSWLPDTGQFLQAAKLVQKKKNQAAKEIEGLSHDMAKIVLGDIEANLNTEKEKLVIKNAKLQKVKDMLSKTSLIVSSLSRYDRKTFIDKKTSFLHDVANHNKEVEEFRETYEKYKKYLVDGGEKEIERDLHTIEIERGELSSQERQLNDEIIRLTNQIENITVTEDPTLKSYDIISISESIVKNEAEMVSLNEMISDSVNKEPEYEQFNAFSEEIKTAISTAKQVMSNVALVSTKIAHTCGEQDFRKLFDSAYTEDIDKDIETLKGIIAEKEQQLRNINAIMNEKGHQNESLKILKTYIPDMCKNKECSLVNMLLQMINADSFNEPSKIDQINKEITEFRTIIEEKTLKRQNLSNALFDIGQMQETMKNLTGKTCFLPKTLREEFDSPIPYTVIVNCGKILEELGKYEDYVSLLEKIEGLKKSTEGLKCISHALVINNENKKLLEDSISHRKEIVDKITGVTKRLFDIDIEINTLKNLQEKISEFALISKKIKDSQEELNNRKLLLLKENEMLKNKRDMEFCYNILNKTNESLERDINEIRSNIERYKTQMTSYDVLKSRKDNLEIKKNIYQLAYDVWSTDGYPSLLIKDFLDGVIEYTNKDLDTSWGGMLSVDNFVLDSTSLRIPIIRGETKLNDVSECSKAEKATMDLAISMGINEASTENSLYNIIRCDEVDAGFDANRRQSFLDILSMRLRDLNCKNAFCITHSNCFENIECDVILLKGYDTMVSDSSLINKNVIYRYDRSII